ncbi:hypothetical protein ACFX2A_000433 [Malus domestica]
MDLLFYTRVRHPRKEGDGWHSFSASLGWISGILHWFKELCGSFDSRVEALENQEQAHMVCWRLRRLHPSIKRKQTSAVQGWKHVKKQGRKEGMKILSSVLPTFFACGLLRDHQVMLLLTSMTVEMQRMQSVN